MQLALFTPGAYIWPVHRSFEAFIAALGTPSDDASAVSASALYPARVRTDSVLHGFEREMDERLRQLHRELYDALLRPASVFAGEERSMAQLFWPDLADTSAGRLLTAFYFFFVHRDPADMGVIPGLSVIRAAFFSHEAAEPEIWVIRSQERLAQECAAWPSKPLRLQAPVHLRLHDLHFAAQSEVDRPLSSPSWITGRIKRKADAQLELSIEFGLDPVLEDPAAYAAASSAVEAGVAAKLGAIFGWRQEAVA